jgi:hypothetical protein
MASTSTLSARRRHYRDVSTLPVTGRQLSVFGIDLSSFDEAIPLGSGSSLDIDLLDWFSRNQGRVMEYLSSGEA